MIPGFSNYLIDLKKMEVVNVETGHVLKPSAKSGRAVFYKLYKNGRSKTMSVFEILHLVLGTSLG